MLKKIETSSHVNFDISFNQNARENLLAVRKIWKVSPHFSHVFYLNRAGCNVIEYTLVFEKLSRSSCIAIATQTLIYISVRFPLLFVIVAL